MNRLSPEMIQSYAGQRRKMVEEQLVERGIKDLPVLEAMSRVPRHLFAQESLQHRAYGDTPLPIGENQTISQPYIVGAMTAALGLKGEERVPHADRVVPNYGRTSVSPVESSSRVRCVFPSQRAVPAMIAEAPNPPYAAMAFCCWPTVLSACA